MNRLLKRFPIYLLIIVTQFSYSQISPYTIPPLVFNESSSSGTYNHSVINAELNPVNMSSSAKYDVKGQYFVHIKPNSSACNYVNGGFFHVHTDNKLLDVVSYHQNGFVDIPTFDKFELGLKLPAIVENKINDFFGEYLSVLGGGHNGYGCDFDNSNGNINPYDPDQISIEATFHFPNAPDKKIFGFYYREYSHKYVNPNAPASFTNVDWEENLNLKYHWRVRFAPSHVGTYTVTWEVKTNFGNTLLYSDPIGQTFNTINSNDPGYVKLGQTKNFLITQPNLSLPAKTILPIGMVHKLPLEPIGFNPANPNRKDKDVISTCDCSMSGCLEMHYPYRYINHKEQIQNYLKDKSANLVRIWNLHDSYDIEYEVAGVYDANPARPIQNGLDVAKATAANLQFSGPCPTVYKGTNRQAIMWEFDKLLDLAHEGPNQLYIHLVLDDPDSRYNKNTWVNDNPYSQIISSPTNGSIIQLFSDPEAIKAYKNKLRYIISRYGYSTNILTFEMFNEHDFLGNQIPESNNPLDDYFKPWLEYMTNYIKDSNGLNHNEHLLTLSYANINTNEQEAGKLQNIDFLSSHPYVYQNNINEGRSYYNAKESVKFSNDVNGPYKKPCQAGEMGLQSSWGLFINEKMFPEFMASNAHSLLWATTFIGGLTSGLQMWYSGLDHQNHQIPNIICGQGFSQHFRPLQEFIKNIEFDANNYKPNYFWDNDESGIESYYLISDGGVNANNAIGYVRNRTFWWQNFANSTNSTFYDPSMVQSYINSFASTPTPDITNAGPITSGFSSTFPVNGLQPYTNYIITWFNTYIDPTISNNVIGNAIVNTNGNNFLNIQTPVFGDCQNQEFGFKISKQGSYSKGYSLDEEELINTQLYENSITTSTNSALVGTKNIVVFPNPTSKDVNIKFVNEIKGNYYIKLYDLSGRLILSTMNSDKLNVEKIENGTYLLELTTGVSSNIYKINVLH
ncbi:MAG: T9SS type A sorting domain-containing protein [Bacteroidia bacterium]